MYPLRKELVGKRFLCVRENSSRSSTNRPNSRSNKLSDPLEYQWKCGIIRACSEQESSHPEQKVLVEYDNEDWTTREWIQLYSETWKIFLVEKNIVWAQRVDPKYPRRSLLWPALTFYPLIDKHGLDENNSIGVEFLGDHLRAFCQANEMRPYQEDDGLQPALRNNSEVLKELLNWQTLQKSQGILIHGPFTLTGFRVQVYREKCRQWFSAVITSHDLITRELDVMDDTVLQTHRINPRLVMVLLLANDVELDSMLRGDLVRVLPVRRNRQAQVVITSAYTSTSPNSTPGNSMWQFLNDIWSDPPPSTTPIQPSGYQTQAICSPSVNMMTSRVTTATNSTTSDRKRGMHDSSRTNKEKTSIDSKPTTDEDTTAVHKSNPDSRLLSSSVDASLEQDRSGLKEYGTSLNQQELENSSKNLALKRPNSSPASSAFRHSPLRSPIASPVHYQSPYSSLENLSNSNSNPQSGSKPNISPQRSFGSPQKSPLRSSSALILSSPGDHRSPPKIFDPHFTSPSHTFNQTPPKKQFTPSSSKFSPLRTSKLSPVLSSPTMHMSLENSGHPVSTPCINPMGHGHDTHQIMGACSCSTRQQNSPQNIMTNQLYALQLQQQRQIQNQQLQQLQHEQNMSQFYMQMNQLQLIAEQLKSSQQGALSPEQRETLNFYYNQIISHYQQANFLKYHSAVASQDIAMLPAEQQMQILKEQLNYFNEHPQQNNVKWQHSLPEKDQLKSFLSQIQQNANIEQFQNLYAEFTNQASKEIVQEDEDSVEDHVARLKKFIPSKQEKMKANLQTPSTSSFSFGNKDTLSHSPLKESMSSALPLIQAADKDNGNKTDDQKVVDALVRKPSVTECPSTKVESNNPYNTLRATKHECKAGSIQVENTKKYKLDEKMAIQETKTNIVSPKKDDDDDDPFGFNNIGDDVGNKQSQPMMSSSLDESSGNNINSTKSTKMDQKRSWNSKSTSNKVKKGKKTVVNPQVDHKSSTKTDLSPKTSPESISSRESVIKYVVNKSEPLVSSLNNPNKEVSSLETESLSFSVDQLLEFHKTSAQAAVKVFQETHEKSKTVPEGKQTQGKKRKKEGKKKMEFNKEILSKNSTKCVKQMKNQRKRTKSEEGAKEKLNEGFDEVSTHVCDSLNEAVDNKAVGDEAVDNKAVGNEAVGTNCKKQKVEDQKAENRSSDSFLHVMNNAEEKCRDPSIDSNLESLLTCSERTSNDKVDNSKEYNDRVFYRRSPVQDQHQLYSKDASILSNSRNHSDSMPAISVNFVADQAVKSLTTFSRATEPVPAISFCGIECVVEQIETSEASASNKVLKTETTRQRKKSRKVIENELSELEQDKVKEEENGKAKKKSKSHQKNDIKTSKDATSDNVDERIKETLATVPKKNKNKNKSMDETSDNIKQEDTSIILTKKNKSKISTEEEAWKYSVGNEKIVKDTKNKKSKKKSKNDNIDLEETSESDTKNKKSKKTSKKEASKDPKRKENLIKDNKNKKSKKGSMEESPDNVGPNVKEALETDTKNRKTNNEGVPEAKEIASTDEETNVKEKVKTEMDQEKKTSVTSIKEKCNQKEVDVKRDLLQINCIDECNKLDVNNQEKVKAVNIDHDSQDQDKIKKKAKKTPEGKKAKKIKQEKITDIKKKIKKTSEGEKEKRKVDKKVKQTKSKISIEQKEKKSQFEILDVKQDNFCGEMGQNNSEESETRLECSTTVQNEENLENKTWKDDEDVEKNAERNKEGFNTNSKSDDEHGECRTQNLTKMDEENITKEIKKQISGSKETSDEETKSIKRKQDDVLKEFSPKKKKRKVKEPTEEYFLQNSRCLAFSKLQRCRDCRDKEENPLEGSHECCRFILFRRLKKKKSSERVRVAGFLAPENAEAEDFDPWIGHKEVLNTLNKEEALYIIRNVADEFCSLVQEEQGAKALMAEGSSVAYKRAVIGLREMCDACATTIFNVHWVCQKCGFGVCLDCYELRIKEKTMLKCGKKAFEFKWFNCMPGVTHQPKNLNIAQIIPNKVLNDLSEQLHYIQSLWNIEKKCSCNSDPDTTMKKELPQVSTEDCKSETRLDNAQVKEEISKPDTSNKMEQGPKENKEGILKHGVKKSLMERVRERLREKLEAQKSASVGTPCQEQQIMANCESPNKKSTEASGTTNISVDKTSTEIVPDSQLSCYGESGESDSKHEERDLKRVDEVKTSRAKECTTAEDNKLNECTTAEDNKLADNQGVISMSGGLSLLMSYDSSPEDSLPSTPCKPSSSAHTFNFNLGLLALVASNEQEKRTEVTNADQQPQQHELQGPREVEPREHGPQEPQEHEHGPRQHGPSEYGPTEHGLHEPQEHGPREPREHEDREIGPVEPPKHGPHEHETPAPLENGPHDHGPHAQGPHEHGPHAKGPHDKGPHEHGTHAQGPHEHGSHEHELHKCTTCAQGPPEHGLRVCEYEEQQRKDEDRLKLKDNLKNEKMMDWFKTIEEERLKDDQENKNCKGKQSSVGESTSMPLTMETHEPLDAPRITKECPAPHTLLCNGRLLRLHEPHHPGNQEAFAKRWKEGKPVLVSDVDKLLDCNLWSPGSFEREFGDELADVVNCRTGKTLENFGVGAFWKGFESVQDRIKDNNGEPMLLKLKDWPPAADFSEKLPSRFKNLMDYIPLPEYTRRDKARNLASRLPNFFVKPDLGPKMYNAYGSAAFPTEGTTNLHIDMSDAVNIMVYVGVPREQCAGEQERKDAIKAVDNACDEIQQQRVRRETARIGALWHIFDVDDADSIREFLHEVARERKLKYPVHHDPIHDQCFYLDHELRERLKRDYNVEGYAVCQCLGDGVFIPAGAPHQVRNLYSCIKIAEDFVSPERIGQCLKTTQEFRHLTDKHSNHEDKLQIKNIIYHAVKDAVHVLKHHESTDK